MKTSKPPLSRTLADRLTEAEATIHALLAGQIDAVFDSRSQTPVLLAKAQDALRLSEERLRHERDRAQQYLDAAEVMLVVLDTTGRITLANRYACSVLERTAEELRNLPSFEECIPPLAREAVQRTYASLLNGTPSIVTNPILTKSGKERLIEWRNTVLRDNEGQVSGVLTCGTDITDRTSGTVALDELSQRTARRERILTTTLSSISDFAYTYDRDGRFLFVNQPLLNLWGITLEEAVGKNFFDLGYPHDLAERLQRQVEQVFATGKGLTGETPYTSPAGVEGWFEYIFSPAFGADGKVEFVSGSTRDITSRKKTEAELRLAKDAAESASESLRDAEERTRFALESAHVGIWDMDYRTGALRWSANMEEQYGLPAGSFDGTFEMFVERVHPDDLASMLDTINAAMKSGADFTTQHRVVRSDGAVRWLSGAGRVQLGEDGAPMRGIGISLDVTDRRTLEAQYQQAQKMEAIGQLAGGVAHDFNNLLTEILGHCELLLGDLNAGDPRRADIAEIHRAGTRGAGLTRQLLAFSRKQIIEPMLLDLNMVVLGMRAMLGRLIGEDVEIVVGLVPGVALVRADRGQVEQVVMNLALNARDAMPDGGTLTIETADADADEQDALQHPSVIAGPYVVLTVSDTGTGITPQVQARLFEPFFTTKETGKGTGLGLATVHGIATQGGGSVHVHSELGKGTSFKVYFPRAEAPAIEVAEPRPRVRPSAGAETVLLVEDVRGLREIATRMLQRQGYTVVSASSAAEALRLFGEDASIDVVLTDVVMPGGSGPEMARAMRELRPGLKVIFMSGYTDEVIVHHGVLNPGVMFLHKPFTAEALGHKVREALDR